MEEMMIERDGWHWIVILDVYQCTNIKPFSIKIRYNGFIFLDEECRSISDFCGTVNNLKYFFPSMCKNVSTLRRYEISLGYIWLENRHCKLYNVCQWIENAVWFPNGFAEMYVHGLQEASDLQTRVNPYRNISDCIKGENIFSSKNSFQLQILSS